MSLIGVKDSTKDVDFIVPVDSEYKYLIISKLMRGTTVDFQDCFTLVKARKDEIDPEVLTERFLKTSKYDVSEERLNKNLEYFFKTLGTVKNFMKTHESGDEECPD